MLLFFLLAAMLAGLPGTAGATPGPPPGLIGGVGLVPRMAVRPAAPSGPAPPVGPFWRMPPAAAPDRAGGPAVPPGPGLRCRQAIAAAELAEGIPPHLLQAIGVVESGRPVAGGGATLPWPWTIDVNGRGTFLAGPDQAIAAVRAARAAGMRSIDVGCLQVSLLHHPHAFATLREAFDPAANARFAAGFLRRLFARTHDWAAAAAAYHSQTPARAGPYRARVLAEWARLGRPAAHHPGGPFGPVAALALAPPRPATGVRVIRTGPMGGPVPPGRSLAAYRARPIRIDRGG